jgi:glucose/arabinose dehydrogenase
MKQAKFPLALSSGPKDRVSKGRRFALVLRYAALYAALSTSGVAGAAPCAADNGGLKLPDGVCATIFADKQGPTRHLAVGPDGTVYANTWANPRRQASLPPGGMLVALRDTDSDGKADKIERFGDTVDRTGGTGLAIFDNHLYAEVDGSRIVRFPLASGTPKARGEAILDDLPKTRGHTMHSIAISNDGSLYVNSGSATNSCQVQERTRHSAGEDPCAELATRAGIWRYDAKKTGQRFNPAERFATGLRNVVAMDVHPSGALYAAIHGRDQLHEHWPEKFDQRQGSELPSEVFVRVERGSDHGWPYCYYDQEQKKYVTAPEYGGDGKKTDRCEGKPEPVFAFPGHWAPNGLAFAPRNAALPARYRQGAFIVFHGSWNRDKQQGYNVVFLPMGEDGKASGSFEVFADGFAGPNLTPEGALHRPSGIAFGPDGALYISDDKAGRIWRIAARG